MSSPIIYTLLILAAVQITVCRGKAKIIGGMRAQIEDHPYQVSLQYFDKHHCGGAIISELWIITAAHCVHGRDMRLFSIRVGSAFHDRSGSIHDVNLVVRHSQYNTTNLDYDIAVIRVSPVLKLGSPGVNKITLATKKDANTYSPSSQATVTGWGVLDELGFRAMAHELQAVKVQLIDRRHCARLVVPYPVTDRMLCAGNLKGGKDACEGDSGGPLVLRNVLIGIVSWGDGCGRPNKAGVYSNVANLREWVKNTCGV